MFTDTAYFAVSWEFVGDEPVLRSVIVGGQRVDEEMSPWLLDYLLKQAVMEYEDSLNRYQLKS